MTDKKVIVTGSYSAFLDYCRKNQLCPSKCIYADKEEKVYGLKLKPENIVFTGEYWRSKITYEFLKTRFIDNNAPV
jgi:hypothetical protein